MSNFISHFTWYVIFLSMLGLMLNHISKRNGAPDQTWYFRTTNYGFYDQYISIDFRYSHMRKKYSKRTTHRLWKALFCRIVHYACPVLTTYISVSKYMLHLMVIKSRHYKTSLYNMGDIQWYYCIRNYININISTLLRIAGIGWFWYHLNN